MNLRNFCGIRERIERARNVAFYQKTVVLISDIKVERRPLFVRRVEMDVLQLLKYTGIFMLKGVCAKRQVQTAIVLARRWGTITVECLLPHDKPVPHEVVLLSTKFGGVETGSLEQAGEPGRAMHSRPRVGRSSAEAFWGEAPAREWA